MCHMEFSYTEFCGYCSNPSPALRASQIIFISQLAYMLALYKRSGMRNGNQHHHFVHCLMFILAHGQILNEPE